ncbi:MAG: 50S ribosomal protein L4 [Promethearchaeota archaeon]
MKTKVLSLDGSPRSDVELPDCFEMPLREDLIRRAVRCSWFARSQPQGRDPMAGKRNTAESWGTGYATARVPRLKGSGYPSSRNGAFAPMTVGGRRAHPPRSEKNLKKKINKKERRLALKSAIAATSNEDLVKKRGHKMEVRHFPIVVDEKIQTLNKTQKFVEFLQNISVWEDVARVKSGRKIRAGKGKRRNRKYKRKRGPLLVISDDFGILKAARNVPGIDIVNVRHLSTEHLAPGARPGRLVIWTESSLKYLS